VAVDWSGAQARPESKIRLAEVVDGRMTRLESGRNREEVAAHLVEEARRDPGLVVGLDFAFSFPAWFCRELGAEDGPGVWRAVRERGEAWLKECPEPFWGRPGRTRPELEAHFRETEDATAPIAGHQPKSVFQIGGGGAVGTGSLRGMPHLLTLQEGGYAVFPFDAPRLPLILEIYPRTLTGPVVKSDRAHRGAYLEEGFPEMTAEQLEAAAYSEDAFDAAVSAAMMARHLEEILALEQPEGVARLEGAIWGPAAEAPREAPASTPAGSEPSEAVPCPFCSDDLPVFLRTDSALAVRDRYPVSRGHALVIPRRHVPSVYDLEEEAQAELWRLVARVRGRLAEDLGPDGFTIGVNDGEAAGQTVPHAHIHVIPRFSGDVEDPRGGIRRVRPEQARYW
jgi:diadenosine tetraphosphate (Ap4A) HIT family hydrolase